MGAGDLIIKYNPNDHEGQIKKLWEEINKLRCRLGDCCEQNSGCIPTINGIHGCVINLTTTEIPEGNNFYYTNARVQSFSDPRYAFKHHTHVLSEITDFPSQVSHNGQALFTNGTTPYWAAIPAGYSDAQAIAAVGAILADSSSIDFTFDSVTPSITATVKDTYLFALFTNQDISFHVGDVNAPAAGVSSFTLKDCSGAPVVGKHIKFYRNRHRQFPVDDYTYNSSTGQITLTLPTISRQHFFFETSPVEMWRICTYDRPINTGFPYTFPATFP